MLFTSLEFFIFLPLVLAAFRIVPVGQRWAVLLVASYVFYGFWHPSNLVYLGAVTLVIYLCGRALARSKRASLRAAALVGACSSCSGRSPPSSFMISSPAKSRARI